MTVEEYVALDQVSLRENKKAEENESEEDKALDAELDEALSDL